MNPLFDTPPIQIMSAISPFDGGRLYKWDFSDVLDPGDTIASVSGMVSDPSDLTVGMGEVVDGAGGSLMAVQAALTPGTLGMLYTITAKIITTNGLPLARSIQVPVAIR